MTQKWCFDSIIVGYINIALQYYIIPHFASLFGSRGSELWFPGSLVAATPSSMTSGIPVKWKRWHSSSDITAIQLFRTEWLLRAKAAEVK